MVVNPLAMETSLVQVEGSQRQAEEKSHPPATSDGIGSSAVSSDKVSISPEARQQLDALKNEGQGKEDRPETPSQGTSLTMGKSENDEKEDAVDELEETNSDIKKKEDEIQEAKTTFVGSEEERARKLKELKQDLDDLEDTQKELQSTLAS